MSASVSITRVLPDLLGVNGSWGNAEVLARRLEWSGVSVTVTNLTSGSHPAARPDIVVVAHGTSSTLAPAQTALERWRDTFQSWHAEGTVWFGVGLGGDLLGESVTSADRSEGGIGVGLTPVIATLGGPRFSGEVTGRDSSGQDIAGYLNDSTVRRHDGSSVLAEISPPSLGAWQGGTGPSAEGYLHETVMVSALSGPLLALNPHLADLLIERVLLRGGGGPLPLTDRHRLVDERAARAREALRSRLARVS